MRGAGPGGAGPRGRSRSRAGAAAAAAPSMVMAEPRRPPPALLPLPRGAVAGAGAVRVGFYDIEGTLGKGNFAVVKLARHRITRSEVSGDPPRCPPGAPLGVTPGAPGALTVPPGTGRSRIPRGLQPRGLGRGLRVVPGSVPPGLGAPRGARSPPVPLCDPRSPGGDRRGSGWGRPPAPVLCWEGLPAVPCTGGKGLGSKQNPQIPLF